MITNIERKRINQLMDDLESTLARDNPGLYGRVITTIADLVSEVDRQDQEIRNLTMSRYAPGK